MSLPTTEVTIFDASDALRANPELLAPAIQKLRSHGITVPLYAGVEVQTSNSEFIFVHWDSYDHHKEVTAAPFYAELAEVLALAAAAPPKIFHVRFFAPAIALDKPITEVMVLTLKTPNSRAAMLDILSKISEASKKMVVFGQTCEDENKYILVCGWPSMKVHQETVAELDFAKALKYLFSLVDRDGTYHASLKRY